VLGVGIDLEMPDDIAGEATKTKLAENENSCHDGGLGGYSTPWNRDSRGKLRSSLF
jgi:hypothetical protein